MKSHGAKSLQQFYDARIARRPGEKIAVVALARKLLTMAYRLLKSWQPYDPRQLQLAQGRDGWARLSHPDGQARTVSPHMP